MKPKGRGCFIAQNPEKELVVYGTNQSDFARDFGLHQPKVSDCILEKADSHKGWYVFTPSEDMESVVKWYIGDGRTFVIVPDESKVIDQYFDECKRKLTEH
jgi:hypothetical protein